MGPPCEGPGPGGRPGTQRATVSRRPRGCRSPDPETETLPCQVSEFRQECPWAGDSLLGRQPAQGTKRGSRDAGQPPKGRLPFLLPPAAEPQLGTLSQPSSRGGLSPGAEGGCKEAGGGDGGGRARGGADE